MSPNGASRTPRRRSLRLRLGALCAGLGVVPFALALVLLYPVARAEVEARRAESLARDASRLAAQVRAQVAVGGLWASRLAATPEVRRYLAGDGAYPEASISAARHLLPGVRRIDVLRTGEAAPPPPAPGLSSSSVVRNRTGSPLGTVQVLLDLGALQALVDSYQGQGAARAAVVEAEGRRVAGPVNLAAPDLRQAPGSGTLVLDAGGRRQLAAWARVAAGPGGDGPRSTDPGWIVFLAEPAAAALAPLHAEARRVGLFFAGFAALSALLSWRLAGRFLLPLQQLRQGAEIIAHIHLGHRLAVRTGDELEDLAEQFNRMAENLQGAYGELEERVRDTTLHLREERNRLAAVLHTMTEAVVMTNEASEVLLITPRARLALGAGASSGVGGPLGALVPAARLDFHLRRLRRAWDRGEEAVEVVVFPLAEGRLLRGVLSAVPGQAGERAGFLLVFRDLGAEAGEERTAGALRQVPELLKGPALALRSVLDVLASRPGMEEGRRRSFLAAAQEEAARLTDRLRGVEEAAAQAVGARWPVAPSDPRELLAEALADMPGAPLCVDFAEDLPPSVLVEPYSWVAALGSVVQWVRGRSPGLPFEAHLGAEEGSVVTTFRLEGPFLGDPGEVPALSVAPPGEEPVALEEAVRRNRGELWCRRAAGALEVRMALPIAPAAPAAEVRGIADEQPDFYDFDLFLPRPAAEPQEILSTPLAELEYVVFDTETTGLNPSLGDEVVSLSGVRVRHGRVVGADTFHAVVDPGRPIPPESTRFHGLDDAAVAGAPTLAEVLPQFQAYVGSAVLVAHNAAFDKKFLDLAVARFRLAPVENPILDTLFLSYGVHRDFEGHNLDAIAGRLGVEVRGRHTSLGDSFVTAEVFLRLLPLLQARGIVTLADAKAFCDRMLLFRWQTSRF